MSTETDAPVPAAVLAAFPDAYALTVAPADALCADDVIVTVLGSVVRVVDVEPAGGDNVEVVTRRVDDGATCRLACPGGHLFTVYVA